MPEVKVTSLKAKSVVVPVEGSSIQDLKQKIDTLTTVVKSSNFGGAQPKQQSNNGNNTQKNKNGESRLKVCIRVKDLEPVQQDHSNRDRNHFNAIIVGGGVTVIVNV